MAETTTEIKTAQSDEAPEGVPIDPRDDFTFAYRRRGNFLRLTLDGKGSELRAAMIALWADWEPAVRLEFVAELAHYAKFLAYPEEFPDLFLPPYSQELMAALKANPAEAMG